MLESGSQTKLRISGAGMFTDQGKTVAEVIKDWVTVVVLVGGVLWTLIGLRESISKRLELQLLQSQVEVAPRVEVDMDVEVVGHVSTGNAFIVTYVSIRNPALERVVIDMQKGHTLFIRKADDFELMRSLKATRYGNTISILQSLHLESGSQQHVVFSYPVTDSGVYSVVFELPVSFATWESVQYGSNQESWSVQKFVLVE